MKAILIKKTKERPIPNDPGTYVEFSFTDIDINGLSDMQKAVEGDIESWDHIPELYKNGIVLYCNDEGKLLNKFPAVIVVSKKTGNPAETKIIEQLCGNILLCGYDFEADRSVSLTESQMEIIHRVFKKAFYYTDKLNIDGYAVELEVEDDA